MMSDTELKLATPQDAQSLATIHAEAFDRPWNTAAIHTLLEQPGVFGIAQDKGFILCRVVLDEAEILTLAVRKTDRQGGLGTRLVVAAAAVAARNGAIRLFLEVAQDNVAARALYARAGFTQDGRRKGYYARDAGGAVDALLLSLNLQELLHTG